MSEANLKSELLKHNGNSAVDEEVSRLRDVVTAEQGRIRRLTFWTVGVWAVWFLLISLSLGIPIISAQLSHARSPAATQPVSAPVHGGSPTGVTAVVAAVMVIVYIAAMLGLPVLGIVLAIMLIVTRRTASMNQVRASLASIDAQLRMLGAPGVKAD